MWEHVKAQLALQDDMRLWLPASLMLGIGAYFSLSAEPPLIYALLGGVGLLAVAVILRLRHHAEQVVLPFVLLAFMFFGFSASVLHTQRVYTPMLKTEIEATWLSGRVIERTVGDAQAKRLKLLLDDVVVDDLEAHETPRRISLQSYHVGDDVAPGDVIMVRARLQPPIGPAVPNGFDFRQHSYFQGIGAQGFTLGKVEVLEKAQHPTHQFFSRLRADIAAFIMQTAPHPANTILVALVTGDQSMIPKPVLQLFRDSGLSHLLSVSGVHVGMVCGFVFFTLRLLMALSMRLALYWPIKKISAFAALGVGLFYTLLAGADVPTVRAMIMTALVLCGILLDRITVSLRLLALAATVILLLWPASLLGASFQLSFAAMLALVGFYEGLGRKLLVTQHASLLHRVWLYVAGLFVTSILATLATTPFTAMAFGRTQLYGVLSNAVAVPLAGFVTMPLLFLALLLIPFKALAVGLLGLAAQSVQAITNVAAYVANLPHAVHYFPQLPMACVALVAAGYMVFWLWRGARRWAGLALCVAAFVLPLLFATQPVAFITPQGGMAVKTAAGDVAYTGKVPSKYERTAMRQAWGLVAEQKRPKALLEGTVLEDENFTLKVENGVAAFAPTGQEIVWHWPNSEHIIRGNDALFLDQRQTGFKLHVHPQNARPWQ